MVFFADLKLIPASPPSAQLVSRHPDVRTTAIGKCDRARECLVSRREPPKPRWAAQIIRARSLP